MVPVERAISTDMIRVGNCSSGERAYLGFCAEGAVLIAAAAAADGSTDATGAAIVELAVAATAAAASVGAAV